MSIDVKLNKYTLRMWSEIKAKELMEYEIYAHSEEEAIQKQTSGYGGDVATPIDYEFLEHISDCPETIEIIGVDQGAIL